VAVVFRSARAPEGDCTAEDLAVQEGHSADVAGSWRRPFVHVPAGQSAHMQRHPSDRTARVPRFGDFRGCGFASTDR
jgi:hypothetical protein